jgi:hypothetical protein
VTDCVCDLYGGCCDDARQREYARTFGPSVSTASANAVHDRPLRGVEADLPTPESSSGYAAGVGTLFDDIEVDCG